MSGAEQVRMPVPGWLANDAHRFVESGVEPVVPRLAATIILLRPMVDGGGDQRGNFEVYAQRRASTMAFAPNMYAFPGGSVDPQDGDVIIDWEGPTPAQWADRLALTVGTAQAVVCAAVRELFEEAGVLLAGDGPGRLVGNLGDQKWETARRALQERRLSLAAWLRESGLGLRSDLLAPWARWVTPEFEPRRYDTFFFLARLPPGQATRDVGGEADHTVWLSPAQAAGLPMLPPTAHTLRQLSAFDDLDAVLAASSRRDVSVPVRPRLRVDSAGTWLALE